MKRLPWILAGVLLLLVAGGVGLLAVMPATMRYQLFGDEAALNAVLAWQVQPGDDREAVRRLLGPGIAVSPAEREGLLRAMGDFARQTPASVPDGVEPGDQFLGYTSGTGITIYLQFRDGKLVNFNSNDWEQPTTIAGVSP